MNIGIGAQAAPTGQPSTQNAWSKGDIVQLVALVVGIPAALGAVVALTKYIKSHRLRKTGEYFIDRRVSTSSPP